MILISAIVFVVSVVAVAYTAFETVSAIRIGEVNHKVGTGYVELGMPINITNRGVMQISEILLKLKVNDANEVIVFEGESNKITLSPRESQVIFLNVKMNLSQLSDELLSRVMTKVRGFITTASIQAAIQPFFKFTVAINGKMDWEPPYGDLEIMTPVINAYNTTHVIVQFPLAFKNRSNFLVNGTSSIHIMDGGRYVGYGQTYLEVRPTEEYNGNLKAVLEVPWATGRDPELLVESLKRTYNITFSLPAPIVDTFKVAQNATIDWGAPISDLGAGKAVWTLYNDTHVKVLVPVSFTDESLLPISGFLKSVFFDSWGNAISESMELPFNLEPGQRYYGVAAGFIPKVALQQQIRIDILLDTPYGTVKRGVMIGG